MHEELRRLGIYAHFYCKILLTSREILLFIAVLNNNIEFPCDSNKTMRMPQDTMNDLITYAQIRAAQSQCFS